MLGGYAGAMHWSFLWNQPSLCPVWKWLCTPMPQACSKWKITVNLMFLFQFTITKIFTLVQALLYFISGLFEAGISDKVVETVSSFYTIFKLKCDWIWHWNPRRGNTEWIKWYNKPVTIYLWWEIRCKRVIAMWHYQTTFWELLSHGHFHPSLTPRIQCSALVYLCISYNYVSFWKENWTTGHCWRWSCSCTTFWQIDIDHLWLCMCSLSKF